MVKVSYFGCLPKFPGRLFHPREQVMTLGVSNAEQVQEGDFLEVVTAAPRVVCHFFHRDFERCKIIDKHLTVLARKYFETRFIKLSAPVRPSHLQFIRNVLACCL